MSLSFQTAILPRLLEKEKAALVEEKEKLVRASQELLGDNQLPFDPNDPKVKELEEWECSVSRSVIVEVGLDHSICHKTIWTKYYIWPYDPLQSWMPNYNLLRQAMPAKRVFGDRKNRSNWALALL